MGTRRKVSVGDTEYVIPGELKALKGEIAGVIISNAVDEAKEVMAEVNRAENEWLEENKLKITHQVCSEKAAAFRAMAAEAERLRAEAPDEPEEVAEGESRRKTKAEFEADKRLFLERAESWERQREELGDRAYIEVPDPDGPPTAVYILAGFAAALRLARKQLKQLLAVAVIPMDQLEEADDDGEEAVFETLDQLGKEIFRQGEIEEVAELAVAVGEMIEERVLRYQNTMGKLVALGKRAMRGFKPEPKEEATEKEPSASETPPENSDDESPTGSTSSPPPTGGADERSSSEPVGASSSSSPSGSS